MRLFNINTKEEIHPEFNGSLNLTNFIKFLASENNGVIRDVEVRFHARIFDIESITFINCSFKSTEFIGISNCIFDDSCSFHNISVANLGRGNQSKYSPLCSSDDTSLNIALDKRDRVGWKVVDAKVLVKLRIPKEAQLRGKACDKVRASEAFVEEMNVIKAWGLRELKYKVGQKVYPDKFDNSQKQCSGGIHFFIEPKALLDYFGYTGEDASTITEKMHIDESNLVKTNG